MWTKTLPKVKQNNKNSDWRLRSLFWSYFHLCDNDFSYCDDLSSLMIKLLIYMTSNVYLLPLKFNNYLPWGQITYLSLSRKLVTIYYKRHFTRRLERLFTFGLPPNWNLSTLKIIEKTINLTIGKQFTKIINL